MTSPQPPVRRAARWVVVVATLLGWMTCGWAFRLDPNAYLLLGVPITALFQRYVRRGPIRGLWVVEAPPFRLGWRGGLLACLLAVVPLISLAIAAVARQPVEVLYGLCSFGGAAAAAYAMLHLDRRRRRLLAGCLGTALVLDAVQWSLLTWSGTLTVAPVPGGMVVRWWVGVASLLQYISVVFVLEEVTFRMFDGYLHEADRGRGIASAGFLSACWGLWHLPIVGPITGEDVGLLLLVSIPFGLCLSLFWRRAGNLLVPGLAHALADAIRNALTMGE